jgi:hypothetical protein
MKAEEISKEENELPRTGLSGRLASEVMLGSLVAILSVLMSFVAYQGALSDSAEGDANVEGQKVLSLSNTEFLRANQDIIQDYTMFDGFYLNEGKDEDAAAYYAANFSDALTASMERPDGPFDDAYYDAIYADADSTFDEALSYFDEAQEAGDRANAYQLVVLIFAVGLALAAWASVINAASRLRPVFSALSLLILIIGLVVFFIS